MSDTPQDDAEVAPAAREFLTVVFKYKFAILATFVAVVLTVGLGSFLMAPVYEVDARLLVKFGRENIYTSEVGDNPERIVTVNTEEILNSEVAILTSRDLLRQVVTEMTVEALYPGMTGERSAETAIDDAIDALAGELEVDAVRKSNVIEIRLEHRDPDVAQRTLVHLVEGFTERHLLAFSDPRSSYFEGQLEVYKTRLQNAQTRLEDFKQQTGVFSLPEQRTLLLTQRSELDSTLKTAESRINELRHGIAALTAQLAGIEPDVPLSTENERYRSIDDAKNQLLTLRLREQELLRVYTERNQLVVSVRQEMAIVEKFVAQMEGDIKSRVRTGQNIVYLDLQRDLLRLQGELPAQEARASSLRSQLAQLNVGIPTLDQQQNDIDNLTRELSVSDRNYLAYQERVEGARILDELNRQRSASISVIQAPTVPTRPVRPRKALNLALAAMVGLLGGLALAFANELTSQSLSTPESVERRLGLRVLTTVMDRKLVMEDEMVQLHQQLSAVLQRGPASVVQFMASRECEGTSSIAREFARVAAQRFGQRVLLLSFDTVLGAIAPGPVQTGFQGTGRMTASVLPSEVTYAAQAVDPMLAAATWDGIRRSHDLVIVDAPPATKSTEGLTLGAQVDGVILVVEADATRWPVALRTKKNILRSGGRLLGVVFNRRRHYIPAFLYDWL